MRCLLGCSVVAAVFSQASISNAGGHPKLPRALSAFDITIVERARHGAARRLENAECRRVLLDFADHKGHSLAERLEPWGVPASEYVKMLAILNGDDIQRCRSGMAALVSTVDTPRIYVCPLFASVQVHDPRTAEAMVIHEMLHTLGLGEDPPTSIEITSRVLTRCS